MPRWQDRLFIGLAHSSNDATDSWSRSARRSRC